MAGRNVDYRYVREHADFETVAAHYDLDLEGNGAQRSVLCPFHREKTASCKINLDKKIFNCFGCSAQGNILDFIMEMEKTTVRPAALKLAEICGIDTSSPRSNGRPGRKQNGVTHSVASKIEASPKKKAKKAKGKKKRKKQVADPEVSVPADAENKPLTFTLDLDPTHPYLAERGITDDVVETFGIGFASRGLMQGRIAIPVHNEVAEVVAYAGRWAEKEPPEGEPRYLLPKGFLKQLVVFNLHRLAERVDEVVLVESYWSVFRLHMMGVPVVSTMGRSISPQQRSLLRQRGATRAIVLFDGDEPGRTGAETVVSELVKSFYVHCPEVPDGFKPHRADEAVINKLVGC